MVSRRTSRKTSSILRLKSGSQREIRAMKALISKGPLTVVLVFSKTCPHCTTYKPIWENLCNTQGRKANMVSMEASTFQKTPLSQKQALTGVPTVLYVNQRGEITEAPEPRNTEVMTNVVRTASPLAVASPSLAVASPPGSLTGSPPLAPGSLTGSPPLAPGSLSGSPPLAPGSLTGSMAPSPPRSQTAPLPLPLAPASIPLAVSQNIAPVPSSSENPLSPLPGSVIQSGGNPMAAFIMAARQAGPAALLLGAYAALPRRSSGLSAPRKTRRRRSSPKT